MGVRVIFQAIYGHVGFFMEPIEDFFWGGTTLDEKHFPSGREGSKGISIPRMAGRWPGPTGRIFPVCFPREVIETDFPNGADPRSY